MHMDWQLVDGINRAYSVRTDPIVFALTGRTGSGCTTAANILSKPFNEIALNDNDRSDAESRKDEIVISHARVKWAPFAAVTVSSVIFSFLLFEELPRLSQFLIDRKIPVKGRDEFEGHHRMLAQDARFGSYKKVVRGDAKGSRKNKISE